MPGSYFEPECVPDSIGRLLHGFTEPDIPFSHAHERYEAIRLVDKNYLRFNSARRFTGESCNWRTQHQRGIWRVGAIACIVQDR